MYPIRREGGLAGFKECPICRGRIIEDMEKGEALCQRCGYVAFDQVIDSTPEWRSMDYEERTKRMRVGMPNTLRLADRGLSTEISSEGRDSHGRYLDLESRQSAQRMKKWQQRLRTSTSRERSLSNALSRISEAADVLSLPSAVLEEASHIFRKSVKHNISKSKSVSGMAAASLYLACRKSGVNRSLKEIAQAAGIKNRDAARFYRILLNGVESPYIPPPTVQKYISKLINKEKINPRVERVALELADRTNESSISSGKTPAGLAAAYVYIAAVLSSEHIPQREIAEYGEVTEVTVRNRCREILGNFVIRVRLRTSNG
jgi:transcription initiation factor TFIIB